MTTALLIGLVFLGLGLVMAVAWLVQRRLGNAGWVDVFWTFALGAAGVIFALAGPRAAGWPARRWIVALLAAGWALRLGLHLARRVAHGPEDARYAAFRQDWGADFQRRMFRFLQIQAAAAAVLSVAMLLAAHNPAPGPQLSDIAGVAVLAVAILGAGIADNQLRRFKADPRHRGGVCDIGLWRWSRHPNYFFEWLGWLAWPLLAVDAAGAYPWGWLAWSAPAFMYWLLVHVSGVPPLEAQMLRSRGDAFRAYQARTSRFLPWPPRRPGAAGQ